MVDHIQTERTDPHGSHRGVTVLSSSDARGEHECRMRIKKVRAEWFLFVEKGMPAVDFSHRPERGTR